MGVSDQIEMDDGEVAEFLGRGGTGVLSFSTDRHEPPYSLPVSYGYDQGEGQFYFRLAFPDDSGKWDIFDNPVSFVAHGRTDDGWESAVATGSLEEVTDADPESSAVQRMWTVEIPLVDVFKRPTREVSFRYFRLVPDRLTGRKESDLRE